MPVQTRSQKGHTEAQLQALITMMEKMEQSQKKLEDKLEENRNKMEESQQEINNKVGKSQKKIEDKMEKSQKKIEEKLEESWKVMEEGLDEMKQVAAVKQELGTAKREISCIKQEMEDKVVTLKAEMLDRMQTEVRTVQNKLSIGSTGSKVKPPTFDGKIPWSIYLRQFEAACEINGWLEPEKATALILALRGDALHILQTIPGVQKDYKELVTQINMRFGDQHMQPAYQMQLRTRNQKSGETLQEFESDVARLLRLSYLTAPADFLEQIGVETFVKGIRDADTQQALLLAGHKTLGEALGQALKSEAAKQASRSNLRVQRMEVEDHNDESTIIKLLKEMRSELESLKAEGERRTGAAPTCWRCGRQGHVRSSCRSRATDSRRETQN